MKKSDDQITDEACLLYVAMTRAKKYLYITASSTKEPVFSGGSYEYRFIPACAEEESAEEEKDDAQTKESFDSDESFETLKEIYNYEYPYKEAAALPKKAAVSKLYPRYLDTDEEVAFVFGEDEPLKIPVESCFLVCFYTFADIITVPDT